MVITVHCTLQTPLLQLNNISDDQSFIKSENDQCRRQNCDLPEGLKGFGLDIPRGFSTCLRWIRHASLAFMRGGDSCDVLALHWHPADVSSHIPWPNEDRVYSRGGVPIMEKMATLLGDNHVKEVSGVCVCLCVCVCVGGWGQKCTALTLFLSWPKPVVFYSQQAFLIHRCGNSASQGRKAFHGRKEKGRKILWSSDAF